VRELAAEGFVGANVTVPHKGAALSLADSLAETAEEIGAANTLSFAAGGRDPR
jgi:shikimate dehydrogenase